MGDAVLSRYPSIFLIDRNNISSVSKVIAELDLKRDSYDDPHFFPPRSVDQELQLGYFVAMVAIDHRTGTPLGAFEGYVNGEFFHGADLLYRLGMLIFKDDPEFFSADRLSRLTYDDSRRLLEFDGRIIWDYHVRTFLLRDIGEKTLEFYDSFRELLDVRNVLELIERLKLFRAYEDPVAKKSYLLAKFLDGRELVRFLDKENFEVAVDNHLSRLAIRLGIIRFLDYTYIEKQIEVPRDFDVELRLAIRKAWKLVSKLSNVDPFTLDDFLWSFGRRVCRQNKPKCGDCPFRDVCLARSLNKYWFEHRYILTWYY